MIVRAIPAWLANRQAYAGRKASFTTLGSRIRDHLGPAAVRRENIKIELGVSELV